MSTWLTNGEEVISMFKVGHLVIYSVHGICKIDSISEKEIARQTETVL
ncbi:CarD family transcriptional regulator [Paenibacillus sp. D2_2]